MNKLFKVTIDPPIYDVSHLVPKEGDPESSDEVLREFHLGPGHIIIPEIPSPFTYENNISRTLGGLNVNLPQKVAISVASANLSYFSWRQVQIPVAIGVVFHNSNMPGKGLSMSFKDKSNKQALITVPVAPEAWRENEDFSDDIFNDPKSPYNETITGEDIYGQTDYWNMTYFVDLPKCSMNYEFWVTARGLESEHKIFEIEFYVDDQKITKANFDKMAEQYQDLNPSVSLNEE